MILNLFVLITAQCIDIEYGTCINCVKNRCQIAECLDDYHWDYSIHKCLLYPPPPPSPPTIASILI